MNCLEKFASSRERNLGSFDVLYSSRTERSPHSPTTYTRRVFHHNIFLELNMPIYIKYGDIKGDVTAEGHKGTEGWVEVNSFQFGVGRGISSPTGGSSDRESSAPSVSEIVVTKPMDKSSYRWLEESLYGEGQAVTIDFCKTDKGKLEVYASYTLEDCMVSGYSVNSGGDRPSESLSLNFTKVIFNFSEMGAKNDKGETPKTGWDIAAAKAV